METTVALVSKGSITLRMWADTTNISVNKFCTAKQPEFDQK